MKGKKYTVPCFLLLVLFSFLWSNAQAQPTHENVSTSYEDALVLWRGFSHEWTYNHRLNRLGSYIENPDEVDYPYQAKYYHSSATGLGADVGIYDGYYTFLAANGVNMIAGDTVLNFTGKEGTVYSSTQIIEVDAPGKNYPEGTFEVVLNGFDIISEQKADKLHMFRIEVNDAEYLPRTDKFRFNLDITLLVRCQSIECNRFNNKYDYKLKVHYALFNGAKDKFHSTEKSYHRVYDWEKEEEVENVQIKKQIIGEEGNQFPDATVAFKSMMVTLDQPHWFLEWHSHLSPRNLSRYYAPETGAFKYTADMLFKQWTSNMKKESASPKQSKYSSKRSGWATFDGNIVLLQFQDAYVMHRKTKGTIKWLGSNNAARGKDAVKEHELSFGEEMLSTKESELLRLEKEREKEVKRRFDDYVLEIEQKKEIRKEDKRQEKEQKKVNKQEKKAEKR